jgi:hypothetical protein
LAKREGITLFGALLATIGLNIGFSNGISLLLLISPLAADGCVALADPDLQQTLHDRLAKTMIVASRRGYSLDLRVKRLLAQFQQRMK